jgi:hypothetical protein
MIEIQAISADLKGTDYNRAYHKGTDYNRAYHKGTDYKSAPASYASSAKPNPRQPLMRARRSQIRASPPFLILASNHYNFSTFIFAICEIFGKIAGCLDLI